MRDAKISRICLEGCTGLENLFLRGLPNLVELDLSGTRIKILDFTTMVMQVPCLKRLFPLGCDRLVAIRSEEKRSYDIRLQLDLLCIDTRAETGFLGHVLTIPKSPSSYGYMSILLDSRLARSLLTCYHDWYDNIVDVYFNILVTDVPIVYSGEDVQPEASLRVVAQYGDVPTTAGDAPMQDFPPAPTRDLDRHVGFAKVGRCMNWIRLIEFSNSLHLHDISTGVNIPMASEFDNLRQCRVERCPKLDTVFPRENHFMALETIWAKMV